MIQVIYVRGENTEAPPGVESKDGVSKAMRDARNRHFRKLPEMDPELVEKIETQMIEIINSGVMKNIICFLQGMEHC